jgi:serine/threonine protein kinase
VELMREDEPERFGRFVVVSRLRKGGMGSTSIAVDTADGRIVVIKRPNANAGDQARFREEVQVSRTLGRHPHLVEVVDSGSIGGGDYLALEWIAGQDLETLVERAGRLSKRVPLNVAASIIAHVCSALEYAHGRDGFVHRDVKPGNVMVSYDGTAKLIDYGGALSKFKRSKTEVGRVFGSVGYIAPELAKGALATEASDLYAVGAVLFFMLTGTPPYGEGFDGNGKDVLKHRLAELHANEQPDALVTLLWRALQTNPRNRHESGAHMRRALEAAVALASPPEVVAFVASVVPVEKKYAAENSDKWRALHGPAKASASKTATIRAVTDSTGGERSTAKSEGSRKINRTPVIVAAFLFTVIIVLGVSLFRRHALVAQWLGKSDVPDQVGTAATPSDRRMPAFVPLPPTPSRVHESPVVVAPPAAPEPAREEPPARPPTAMLKRLDQARALAREGKTIKATDLFDELDRDPRMYGPVKVARAELAAQQGDYDGAISLASTAVRLGAGARALGVRADAEMKAGRFELAERDYDRLLKIEPNNSDAREGKQIAQERQKKGPQ